jgi:hypothetical protein
MRKVADAAPSGLAFHRHTGAVDRVDLAGESAVDQVLEDRVAELAGRRRSTDDGDAARRKKRIKFVHAEFHQTMLDSARSFTAYSL